LLRGGSVLVVGAGVLWRAGLTLPIGAWRVIIGVILVLIILAVGVVISVIGEAVIVVGAGGIIVWVAPVVSVVRQTEIEVRAVAAMPAVVAIVFVACYSWSAMGGAMPGRSPAVTAGVINTSVCGEAARPP
jgi:hypothetical protein